MSRSCSFIFSARMCVRAGLPAVQVRRTGEEKRRLARFFSKAGIKNSSRSSCTGAPASPTVLKIRLCRTDESLNNRAPKAKTISSRRVKRYRLVPARFFSASLCTWLFVQSCAGSGTMRSVFAGSGTTAIRFSSGSAPASSLSPSGLSKKAAYKRMFSTRGSLPFSEHSDGARRGRTRSQKKRSAKRFSSAVKSFGFTYSKPFCARRGKSSSCSVLY